MVKQRSPYTQARKVFGLLFVLSTFFLLLFVLSTPPYPSYSPTFPIAYTMPPTDNVIALSMLTSIISLFGFISTTILEWRREKREAKLAELERKRQEIDIEKMRFELDKMKATEEKRRIKKR